MIPAPVTTVLPGKHLILRAAAHESSAGRRTGTYNEFIDNPRLYLAPADPVGNPESVLEYERIRVRIGTAIEKQSKNGGLMTLLTLKAKKSPFDSHQYPDVPTVYIMCAEPETLATAIENIPSSLRVEIVTGACGFAVDKDRPPKNIQTVDQPEMGQSIGVTGVPKSGTLGGYLLGKFSGKTYALTNGHVALMGNTYDLPVIFAGERDIEIVQSSDEDWQNALSAQTQNVAEATKKDLQYDGHCPLAANIKKKPNKP